MSTPVSQLAHADFQLPWDDADAPDPVVALQQARSDLGDTFTLTSADTNYVFVFGAAALQTLYELPERVASKGLADYRMLLRKLPAELFNGRRTFAHDLFGASSVTGYLNHVDAAIAQSIDGLRAQRDSSFDAFAFSRRLGHRVGINSWFGREAPFDELVAQLDILDGAEAFVHPEAMISRDGDAERTAMLTVCTIVDRLLNDERRLPSFLDVVADRWNDVVGNVRLEGIAYDLVVLHIATMTNLFAAIGWAIAMAALYPSQADDLDQLAFEAIRLGQRSIITREVLKPTEFFDGQQTIELTPGTMLATMAPVTNRAIERGDEFVANRWNDRSLHNDVSIATFGHGSHRCPAQRFSMQAITRTVRTLTDTFSLEPSFVGIEPLPLQIGGVAQRIECLRDHLSRS